MVIGFQLKVQWLKYRLLKASISYQKQSYWGIKSVLCTPLVIQQDPTIMYNTSVKFVKNLA